MYFMFELLFDYFLPLFFPDTRCEEQRAPDLFKLISPIDYFNFHIYLLTKRQESTFQRCFPVYYPVIWFNDNQYAMPCAFIASATLRKPAMLAPATRLPFMP